MYPGSETAQAPGEVMVAIEGERDGEATAPGERTEW